MLDFQTIKNAIADPLTSDKWINVFSPYGNKIVNNLRYKENLEQFLADLQRQGNYDFLLLKFYRKNGTGAINLGELQKNFLMQKQKPVTTAPQPLQTAVDPFGLNMPIPTGLNGMEMAYRVQQFPELKEENTKLKDDLETCKEKLQKAERKIDLYEFSQSKKSFWESPAFEKVVEVLPEFTEKLKSDVNQTAGLNAPQYEPEVQMVIDKVAHFDKNTALFVNQIIELIYNSQPFIDELTELIKKYDEQSSN